MKKSCYTKPSVETMSSERLVEMMGPVSCGSGASIVSPAGGDIDIFRASSGNADPF